VLAGVELLDHETEGRCAFYIYLSCHFALLKAGVDFATISQWLGHAGLNTTMRYARADLDMKRQAISQVFPDAPSTA
jgi:integrase